jgi:GPH family glycoside/pentoside/hexuronide:cation symporter
MDFQNDGKLSFKEKFCYGFGDLASCLYWQTFMLYFTYFYTDIFLLPAGIAATMFLITRIFDGVNDPIMGMIADRTETKWGKFRPYLLWFCVPLGIAGFLTFTTPDFGLTGKTVWAYITFFLVMIIYTIINIPYTSLLGVISPNSNERTSVSSIKFIFAFAAGIIISATLLPTTQKLGENNDSVIRAEVVNNTLVIHEQESQGLVDMTVTANNIQKDIAITILHQNDTATSDTIYNTASGMVVKLHKGFGTKEINGSEIFENENTISIGKISVPAKGWSRFFMIVGVFAVLFFFITFKGTKERVHPPKNVAKNSIGKDLKELFTNKPWLILVFATLTFILYTATKSSVTVHYFKYIVQNQTLTLPFMGEQTYDYNTLVSIYNVIGQLSSLLGVLIVSWLAAKFGKQKVFVAFFVISIISTASVFFLDASQLYLLYFCQFLGSVTGGPLSVLLWAMYADIADYSELKNGQRATGLIFSASTMSQKIGWAVGAYIALTLMASVGFTPNEAQTAESTRGLLMMFTIIPAILGVISIIIFFFYPLSDKVVAENEKILMERRAKENETEA